MATPVYYLADTTKEWNLKLLKLPTDGSFNLAGDIYSGSSTSNLCLGTNISRNITGTYNLSLGPNVCSVLSSGSYNVSIGGNSCTLLTSGTDNLGVGYGSLDSINTMNRNIALGTSALQSQQTKASGLTNVYLTNANFYFVFGSGNYSLQFQYVGGGSFPTSFPQGYAQYYFDSFSGYGYVYNAVLTYPGSGIVPGSTFFNVTVPGLGSGSPSATFGITYSDTNSGNDNLAIGYQSLYNANYSTRNIGLGTQALYGLQQTATTVYDVIDNIALGYRAQYGSVTGYNTIGIGSYSLAGAISPTSYSPNNMICIGNYSLDNISAGGSNSIVIGNNTMSGTINNSATTGNIIIGNSSGSVMNGAYNNLIIGNSNALVLTTGYENVCLGLNTGYSLTTGYNNLCLGISAGYSITSSYKNILLGYYAGSNISTGFQNIAIGTSAYGGATSTGNNNICIGSNAGYVITTSANNICIGQFSGQAITTGIQNICIGYNTGYGSAGNITSNNNICIGTNSGYALTTGANNTLIGAVSTATSVLLTTGQNVTTLGYLAAPSSATVSNQITLGNSSITASGGLRCNSQTIVALSDARDKTDIIDIPIGLDFINKVRPIKFTWNNRSEYDEDGNEIMNPNKGIIDAGFIAQELDEVQTSENADFLHLVLKDNPDKMEASYARLLPVMVKAIQELSAKVDSLSQELALLKASK